MNQKNIIKKQLLFLLRGGNAHAPLVRTVVNFPIKLINKKIPNVSYTPWQLLEHLRIAQNDIIQFIKNSEYVTPDWPAEFWPKSDELADEEKWKYSIDGFIEGLREMESIVKDESVDLFAPLQHAETYTIFREVLVLADHNSYHIGQMMLIQKMFS